MRLMSYYLGIEVLQNDRGVFISQNKYAWKILERFGMLNSKPISIFVEIELKSTKKGLRKQVEAIYYR